MYKITDSQIEKLNRISVSCYVPSEEEDRPLKSRLVKLGDLMVNVFDVLNEESKETK